MLSFWSSLHEISNCYPSFLSFFFFRTHQVVRLSLRASSSTKLCEDKNFVEDTQFLPRLFQTLVESPLNFWCNNILCFEPFKISKKLIWPFRNLIFFYQFVIIKPWIILSLLLLIKFLHPQLWIISIKLYTCISLIAIAHLHIAPFFCFIESHAHCFNYSNSCISKQGEGEWKEWGRCLRITSLTGEYFSSNK